MTRTRTTNTWAWYGLAGMCIGPAIYVLILPDLWAGLGEMWIVPITLGVIPAAETIGLSEDLVLTITNPISPLLIPWGIGLVLANTAVTIFQNVVTLFQKLMR